MTSVRDIKVQAAMLALDAPQELIGLSLVGKDTAATGSDYGDSIKCPLSTELVSGFIKSCTFTTYVAVGGSGAVIIPKGHLILFREDPMVSAGDTALEANGIGAKKIMGVVGFAVADWIIDASGAFFSVNLDIPFVSTRDIYAVVHFDSGSATYNSVAGDDEVLDLAITYVAEK